MENTTGKFNRRTRPNPKTKGGWERYNKRRYVRRAERRTLRQELNFLVYEALSYGI